MKIAVLVVWIISSIWGIFEAMELDLALRFMSGSVTSSCIIFLCVAYFIMYRETRRHQEKIKTQQLPQEEVEKFTKENKALKTTLYVICAVLFLPPSTLFLSYSYSYRPLCVLPHRSVIDANFYHV